MDKNTSYTSTTRLDPLDLIYTYFDKVRDLHITHDKLTKSKENTIKNSLTRQLETLSNITKPCRKDKKLLHTIRNKLAQLSTELNRKKALDRNVNWAMLGETGSPTTLDLPKHTSTKHGSDNFKFLLHLTITNLRLSSTPMKLKTFSSTTTKILTQGQTLSLSPTSITSFPMTSSSKYPNLTVNSIKILILPKAWWNSPTPYPD